MKNIMNNPEHYVDETLAGIYSAHSNRYTAADGNLRALVRATKNGLPQVAVVTGGGSGHLPVFLGYVGEGLLSGCAVGSVFASPPASTIETVARAAHSGKGVLFLYGNYQGDVMNFEMAEEALIEDGIACTSVVVADDVASAPSERSHDRRGIAGLALAYKVAGAAAAAGQTLDEVAAITRHALNSTRSLGVALGPCVIPASGKPTFEIAEDEMEIGMGIHGEQGIQRTKLKPAREITKELATRILEDGPYATGDQVAVLLNSLGATPLEELYIMYGDLERELSAAGVSIERCWIGRYACSMEMAGASLTLMRLDSSILGLLDADSYSPLVQFGQ
ncbi:MAG: dihydroxyacetone kinase subunit DhaK [Spirochaetaceae bacterium]|nr:MAG: dihydroxyacetone kinase subunit DhaK [Spirochaetaceae bacterium]